MTTPESRLVRVETELKNAIDDIAGLVREFDKSNRLQIQHDERIERNRHDIKNLQVAIQEAQLKAQNMGLAAHDLISEERRLRREELSAAVKDISVTLKANEDARRLQFDRWFRRIGMGAWTVTSAVVIAYLVSLIT